MRPGEKVRRIKKLVPISAWIRGGSGGLGSVVALLDCGCGVVGHKSDLERRVGCQCPVHPGMESKPAVVTAAPNHGIDPAVIASLNVVAKALDNIASRLNSMEERITDVEDIKTQPQPSEETEGRSEENPSE